MILLFATCSLKEQQDHTEEESERGKLSPNEWFYEMRAYPHGINKEVQKRAIKQVSDLKAQSNFRNTSAWQFAGPTNIGGRITDIEMPANDINIIYAGAASGGIFKSTNQGNSWEPIFDNAVSLSIGDIALAPSNNDVIYVGTGEANAGGGSLAYDGYGVYKSTDAGTNWTHIGLEDVGSIGKVTVDPQNPNRVFVAAMGDLFGNNAERGVYRTLDGGTNWQKVLFVSDSTGAIDVVIHPNNPNVLVAAMWERIRRPGYRQYEGVTTGIYKSTNGGDTWTRLTQDLPSGVLGRIGLAYAPSNPDRLYSVIANNSGLDGIYRSEDFGATWLKVNSNFSAPGYMWWFGRIFVDPNNENKVFTTSLDLFSSTTGANSWVTYGQMHVDQHAVFIHPLNSNLVIAGNDGGVYVSQNGGVAWNFKNTLPITQFYMCEIDASNPARIYGGSQDNGTNRTMTGNLNDWERIFGGDGFTTRVDPTNPNTIYASFQYGNLRRSDNNGGLFSNITPNSSITNWNTPYLLHPSNSNTLLYGSNRVHRSINKGNTWTAISPDLSNGPHPGNLDFGTITTIDVSTIDDNIIYAGTDDGNVWVTKDDGGTWDKVSANLPNRWVTKVQADPFSVSAAYATFSGYRYNSALSHIFKTNDYGLTWTDLSSNLPEVPINDIIVDPVYQDYLYIATDLGVFATYDAGLSWTIMGDSLPNVPITDLDFDQDTQLLLAATYGRSMYKIGTATSVATEDVVATNQLKVYPNPVQTTATIEWTQEKNGKTQLFVMDVNGRVLKELFSEIRTKGEQADQFNLEDLPAGNYFLHLSVGRSIETVKLVKI